MKDTNLLNRMYPEKNDQVKRVILKQAVRAFSENSIAATTVEDIRSRSKVSIGTIYYHFNSKEGILAHLLFAAMDDLFNLRQKYLMEATNFEECVYAFVLGYVDWVVEHPNFAKIIYTGEFDVYNSSYGEELSLKKIENRKKLMTWMSLPENKYDHSHIPDAIMSSLINGPAEHYCKYWLLDRVGDSPAMYRKDLAHATWMSVHNFNLG